MTDALRSFLGSFADAVSAAVEREAVAGATVVLPHPALAEFRRRPRESLKRVSQRLGDLWRTPGPSCVVWCVAGSPGHGLDDFEVPAVIGRYLHLDSVSQSTTGGEKRIVAVGTLRDEHIGVSLECPLAASADSLCEVVGRLAESSLPAIVFMGEAQAERIAGASAFSAIATFIERGGSLGLRVPAAAMAGTLTDPQRAVATLRRLAGTPVRFVRFDTPPRDAAALDRFMRSAGLECDSSMPIDGGAAPAGSIVRDAAYAGASPYRPQPFDLRTPWFQGEPGMWFELPAARVTAESVGDWWAAREPADDDRLARLLDSTRMEAFYRASRINPAEEEHYPDFRIYNWPAPAPASRVWLLDGGECDADGAVALARAVLAAVVAAGPRAHFATGSTLLQEGRREVEARYAISATRAIEAQNEAHEYLSTVPHEAPLRTDYADFARFVAPELGHTLELGSGYGVLAWALSLRATHYTCVDLDRHMFRTLRRDLRQAGVVADLHKLPFAGAAFDSVVANNVLEHLYDPLTGLREIRRVLKPGGRLFALVPFDALNSHHALPAHLWKLDEPGVRAGFEAADLSVARLEVVHLNELGVVGAFPTCHGLAAKVEAVNRQAATPASVTTRAGRAPAIHGLPGRLLPAVREVTGFERWHGRRVVAVNSEPTDVDEFAHFGARVEAVTAGATGLPVADGAADLLYAFLTLNASSLSTMTAEIHRVLAPGGVVVAGFRNRSGLRYLARVRSYFGIACDMDAVSGRDAAVAVAEDDGATTDADYVSLPDVRRAFAGFARVQMTVRGLTPDDVPAAAPVNGDPRFLQWLSDTFGRFVLVRAVR